MNIILKGLKGTGKFIVRGSIYLFMKVVYRTEIKGLENIPKDEPLIFCGNHRTYVDPPLILSTAKRDMRFIAKEELRNNKGFAFLGILFDAIYVKRDAKDIGSIKEVLKALKNKQCIALFPEGTRNAMEKGEKPKDGAIFFAVKSGAKILPCGIKGKIKKWTKTTITYGKPMDFSYVNPKNKEEIELATEKMMNEIINLTK